jgi:alpha-beta hydrolase superfamily lysophospholipase
LSHDEFFLQSSDDLNLYFQVWQPVDLIKGVICLVHGIGEHSGRYAHVAQALNEAGYAFLGMDMRGHGKSGGPRGHVPSLQAVFDDIEIYLAEAHRRYTDLPFFIYGHSLGGLVLNYVIHFKPDLAGVIATSPNLRLAFEPSAAKIALGKMMNNLWPTFSQASGLETAALSRDLDVEQAYKNDPLVHDRVSARLFVSVVHEASQWSLEHASDFPLPLLLMHGNADRLTSAEASREFAAQAGEICTLKIWDGFFHELHNEPEKDQVFAFMLDWLNQCAGISS